METAKFRVWFANSTTTPGKTELTAYVDVIALTSSSAKRFAKKQFFPALGWEVIDCKKLP